SSRRDDERAGELRRDHPRVRHRPRKPRSAAGPAARYPLAQVARAGPAGVTASTHPGESYGNRLGEWLPRRQRRVGGRRLRSCPGSGHAATLAPYGRPRVALNGRPLTPLVHERADLLRIRGALLDAEPRQGGVLVDVVIEDRP